MLGILRISLLIVTTCAACAQIATDSPSDGPLIWQPPTLQFPDTAPQATVPKEIVTALRVAKVPIILEKTELKDVQKRLGGDIGHRGDASESLMWLCYCGADASGRWVLWLESSEMGGGTVDGFAIQRVDQKSGADRRCRTIEKGEGGIELPVALQLGLTEMQIREILGKPTIRYRDTLIFDHEHNELIRGEPFTAWNRVAVAVRDGAVWAIQVWKTTSN